MHIKLHLVVFVLKLTRLMSLFLSIYQTRSLTQSRENISYPEDETAEGFEGGIEGLGPSATTGIILFNLTMYFHKSTEHGFSQSTSILMLIS